MKYKQHWLCWDNSENISFNNWWVIQSLVHTAVHVNVHVNVHVWGVQFGPCQLGCLGSSEHLFGVQSVVGSYLTRGNLFFIASDVFLFFFASQVIMYMYCDSKSSTHQVMGGAQEHYSLNSIIGTNHFTTSSS